MNPELEAVLKNYLSTEAIAEVRADLEAHRVPDTLSAAIVRLEESILRARGRGMGTVKRMMLDVDDVELLIREGSYVDALEAVLDREHIDLEAETPSWEKEEDHERIGREGHRRPGADAGGHGAGLPAGGGTRNPQVRGIAEPLAEQGCGGSAAAPPPNRWEQVLDDSDPSDYEPVVLDRYRGTGFDDNPLPEERAERWNAPDGSQA